MKATYIASSLITSSLLSFAIASQLQAHPIDHHQPSYYDGMDYEQAYNLFLKNFKPDEEPLPREEHLRRQAIFQSNLNEIRELNRISSENGRQPTAGVTRMADLTKNEYKKHLGFKRKLGPLTKNYFDNLLYQYDDLPESIDWRKKGGVTPVKDQGQCGSCWSFSAIGAAETLNFLNGNKLTALSEQQILNCNGLHSGCEGGFMNDAFKYVMMSKGLCSETDFPYLESDAPCLYSDLVCKAIGQIKSFQPLPQGSDDSLMSALQKRTISVAIDSSNPSFMHYTGGVYYEPDCSKTEIDHAVLLIGYGVDDIGQKYWLLKNSWGTSWGEKGFFKMSREEDNMCGISTLASYPE